MSKKRIFIGYQLSEELQQKIGEWRKKYLYFPVRWTPLEFLHVTLVPPWYEENVDEVIRLLQECPNPVQQFSITFESINFGPDVRSPWLIWAKGEMTHELFALRAHLTIMLQKMENRHDPILHTTLARFNREQFSKLPSKQLVESISWEEKITSFSLIQSHLKRTGAEYETLAKITL